ncbi:hypothetical protein, partial [Rhizobium sp. CSW-27]|uniref:hypothetical protein n=1 Tax=Rhizobium sp. CSW-27 TaxID=2839985 RepID=UPI001C010BC7
LTQASGSLIDGGTGDVMLSAGTDATIGQVKTAGAGTIGITAVAGRVDLNDAIEVANGSIGVTAETALALASGASVTATGAGGVSLTVTTGNLTQASGSLIDGGTGNVMLSAGTDATIGQVKTGGDGDLGIFSRSGNIFLEDDLDTADGDISILAQRDISIAATSDITAAGIGDVIIYSFDGSVTQMMGGWIDSGLGQVRIHGGRSVTLRKVRSQNPSPLRIIATAGTTIDDGGDGNRSMLEAGMRNTGSTSSSVPDVPDASLYLEALLALRNNQEAVVNSTYGRNAIAIERIDGGAIILGLQN